MAGADRARKRSASVCVRCRRQKIKCSGSQPCNSCSKRKLSCVFNSMDQNILVKRGYLAQLQKKVALIEGGDNDNQVNSAHTESSVNDLKESDYEAAAEYERQNPPDESRESQEFEDSESGLVNPLAADSPAFMSPGNGRIFYLGTSSNWSFTRRVLSLAHQHVHKEPLPTESLIFEGASYDLGWNEWRENEGSSSPVIPSLDHALHLINTVQFRCGKLYHLFDEGDFMKSLSEFYSQGQRNTSKDLWYVHFLLILAFGKCFTQSTLGRDGQPPGIKYFLKALQILPNHHVLYSFPMVATEVLCCIALFYQSIDHRTPAHNYIGQAMRMAMSHGMHTRMSVEDLGLDAVERCRKIWWTVYILDRHMSSIQGLPQSVDDRFIQTCLPSSSGSLERETLNMHIQLCRSIAEINSTVYSIEGRINRKFLMSTKVALSNIAGLADKLRVDFPLHLDWADHGIPRASAYLHLLYQQCVIVATRPLLFCFLKIKLDSPETCAELIQKSRNVTSLMQMCLESAQHSIRILHSLISQGLLETFLNFDLESIFISTVVLLIGPAINPKLLEDYSWWLEKSYTVFREMVEAGNRVAKFRFIELQQLEQTLYAVHNGDQPATITPAQTLPSRESDETLRLLSPETGSIQEALNQSFFTEQSITFGSTFEMENLGPFLTSAEMIAMADSIDTYDAEWVSNAMESHNI